MYIHTQIREEANQIKNPSKIPNKDILSFSEYLEIQQEKLMKHVIRCPNDDPLRECLLNYASPQPLEPVLRKPKTSWAQKVYGKMLVKHEYGTEHQFCTARSTAIERMGRLACSREI